MSALTEQQASEIIADIESTPRKERYAVAQKAFKAHGERLVRTATFRQWFIENRADIESRYAPPVPAYSLT